MGFVVFTVLYVTGVILTARHLVYRIKLCNEELDYYGTQLEPKLYSKEELRRIRNRNRSATGDEFPDSDYRIVAAGSLFFWIYWIWVALWTLVTVVCTSGVRKTPGEVKAERDRKEQEFAALKLELQRMEEETERLRREQDV